MINVVHFIHGLNMGGAETLVKNYALLLNKNKFNIIILCFHHDPSPYEKILIDRGIKIIVLDDFLRWKNNKNIFFKVLNYIIRLREIKKQLKILRPDIIHIHLNLNKYIKYAFLPKNTRIFYTHHNDVNIWSNRYPNDVNSLAWIIRHYKTQIIALNSNMVKQINDLFKIKNTVVLNNGINLDLYNYTISKERKREELGIDKNAFVIVHVGRFASEKNHSFLIDVFSEIQKKRKNSFLLMVGRGDTEGLVKDKLIKLGLYQSAMILHDRTDVSEILMASDAALFPSISEGLGIAVIEMQAAGLPCVASTGVPEHTRISNKIRYLDLNLRAKVWADTLLSLADKKEQVQYYNLKDWDIKENVKQLEKLYEKAILDD